MSQEKGAKDGFTVVDKRRFTTEGELSSEANEVQEPQSRVSTAPGNEQKQKSLSPTEAAKMQQPEKIDFISFIVSLGTQALVMLGEMPNPETRLQAVNIDAAKQTIDILGMLEEKTKGNLSAEEAKLLSEILTTLRMAFVNKVNYTAPV